MIDVNANEVFSRPNTEAKIHDLEQFTLWTDTPNRPGYRSRLTFGERNGAPRITVFTNFQDGPPVVAMGFHPFVFEEFLNSFEQLVKNPNADKPLSIDNLVPDPGVKIEKNTNRDEVKKVVKNTLVYGKTAEGICFIGVQQPGMPNIAFKLLPSAWHHFKKADGTVITPSEMSCRWTLSVIGSIRRAMDRWTSRIKPAWVPKEKKQDTATEAPGFDVSADLLY